MSRFVYTFKINRERLTFRFLIILSLIYSTIEYMDVLNPTMYLIAFGLIILIAILIARAIFSIPTIVRELKTQNSLLAEIVKMNNLKAEEKVDTVGSQLISDEDLENEALSYPKE